MKTKWQAFRALMIECMELIMVIWDSFGPQKAWETFSQSIDGRFLEGGHSPAVEARQGKWEIRLSTFEVETGYGKHSRSTTYTQVRCPILAQNEFRFSIEPAGFFNRLLAMQDLKTGIPEFDKEFIIKGSDSETIRDLISNPNIRFLIESQIKGKFEIPDQGVTGVDLYFEEKGVIEDIERLKAIFEMFYQTLDHLERVGAIKPV